MISEYGLHCLDVGDVNVLSTILKQHKVADPEMHLSYIFSLHSTSLPILPLPHPPSLPAGVDLSKILGVGRSGQSALTDDIIGVSGAT